VRPGRGPLRAARPGRGRGPARSHQSIVPVPPPRRGCHRSRAVRLVDIANAEGGAISTKEETIEFEGEVTEALRNGMFRIALDNGHETIGYAAGRMRRYRIRIMLGDRVKVQLSAYDLNRGRIVYRYK
jgi:translation initiation factor IF-1